MKSIALVVACLLAVSSSFSATIDVPLIVASSAAAQTHISTCGTLEAGLDCMYFKPFSGGQYLLDNYGGFKASDTVLVSGNQGSAWCMTFQAAAILSNTICKAAIPCNGVCSPCCQGTRGNVNVVGIVDLADLSALVSYLTGGGYTLPCSDAANVGGTGIVDLADLSALVSYLTGGGYVLPDCLAPGFYPNTVGSYWVYADTTFDKISSLVLFTTIDSVAIIGTYHDTLGTWSVLNHAVSWVSDTFMVRGDTLFSREEGYPPDLGLAPSFASAEYIPARDTAFVFNVVHEDLVERRTVVRLNTLLICGAGSFARCVHYYEAGASENVYHDIVAPNVGLVYSSREITPMGHPEIDQLSVQWLIRYHIAP